MKIDTDFFKGKLLKMKNPTTKNRNPKYECNSRLNIAKERINKLADMAEEMSLCM